MEFVSSLVGRIVERLYDAVVKQFGYLYHFNDNFQSLEKQLDKLVDRQKRVQARIDAAENNVQIIHDDVKKWMSQVDAVTKEVGSLLEDEVKAAASKRCLKGICINPKTRYRFSREAKHKLESITELLEGEKFDSMSYRAPTSSITLPSSAISFQSRASIKEQVMTALKDENVNIIGVCGLGGVGKTTLVQEIGKQVDEDKLYGVVAMAVLSQDINVSKIQEVIADKLQLTLSISDRASSLSVRIKQEQRILIILDDVWERIELGEIGIPFGENHRGCKIILTSRSHDVCTEMEAQPIIEVKTLSSEESWALFSQNAGLNDIFDSDIINTAKEMVAKCGGLPIAIKTVGIALRGKSKPVWRDAARQFSISRTRHVKGMHKNVISSLELSYNFLEDDEAKAFFLLCCTFPEDYSISIEQLGRYAFGLKLFEDVMTIEDARGRAHAIVSNLTRASLLMFDDSQERYIRMHDVVRDVAIHLASSRTELKCMVKAGIRLREWPSRGDKYEDCTIVSLMRNEIGELPDGLYCPSLQALLLQGNPDLKLSENFFRGMKNLKVFDFSQFGFVSSLVCSLSPLCPLTNLTTLCLDRIQGFSHLSEVGMLTNLEILSFRYSSIEELPLAFCQLKQLRLLDLTGCRLLKRIPYGVLSSLSNLEELYMDTFEHWDKVESEVEDIESKCGESNLKVYAKASELEKLSRLICCDIKLSCTSDFPDNRCFPNLERFHISAGNYINPRPRDELITGEVTLGDGFNYPVSARVIGWVERTESMRCSYGVFPSFLAAFHNHRFNKLRNLEVMYWRNMEYLVDAIECSSPRLQVAFESLEELRIQSCYSLIEFCRGSPLPGFFMNLRKLMLYDMDMLTVVPSQLVKALQNLKYLNVDNCNLVRCVFDLEHDSDEEEKKESNKLFSALGTLKLKGLREMTQIWKGDVKCVGLCSLTTMTIYSCFELTNLFTPSLVKSLAQLRDLEVLFCYKMPEIVRDEDEKDEGITITFPNLHSLRLGVLNGLATFYGGRHRIEFPRLEKLDMYECPAIERFSYGEPVTPRLEHVTISTRFHREKLMPLVGDLNQTVQQHLEEIRAPP